MIFNGWICDFMDSLNGVSSVSGFVSFLILLVRIGYADIEAVQREKEKES